jgi:hypothetical protein
MNIIYKTTVTPSQTEDTTQAAIADINPAFVNAVGDVMAELAAEEREERELQVGGLREKVAKLEGQIEMLSALLQGKAPVVDLPPLPKLLETNETAIVRKVRVSR